ncbi:hypothetical protein QE152_g40290 [Popillia japonica]|uniref:Uncharacterized protein n=1 Tax=Popillia japonica TaxID=7064 RepID=A0AAW1HSC5_POPJA
MQLKLGRVETNELLEKTFKPIVEPLTKLDSTFKHEMESIKEPLLEMAAKHDESDQPSTPPSTPQQTSTLRPYVGTPLQEYFNTYEALPRSYIRGLLQARSKAYDTTFGPILDLNTNQIKMGKTILNFVKNDIILSEITAKYNNTKHRTIKMKPVDVTVKSKHLLSTVYNNIKVMGKHKFKVGDCVRISKYKGTFAKGILQIQIIGFKRLQWHLHRRQHLGGQHQQVQRSICQKIHEKSFEACIITLKTSYIR